MHGRRFRCAGGIARCEKISILYMPTLLRAQCRGRRREHRAYDDDSRNQLSGRLHGSSQEGRKARREEVRKAWQEGREARKEEVVFAAFATASANKSGRQLAGPICFWWLRDAARADAARLWRCALR